MIQSNTSPFPTSFGEKLTRELNKGKEGMSFRLMVNLDFTLYFYTLTIISQSQILEFPNPTLSLTPKYRV